MFKILKKNTLRALLLNIVLILVIGSGLLVAFFYVYLPIITNHGETITVPNLEGKAMKDVKKIIEEQGLRIEVIDSNYIAKYEPNTVITQNPLQGSKVKLNRKIYLVINATQPPLVTVPDIIDGSVKNAQILLDSYGLSFGKVTYVQDLAANAVKAIFIDGKKVEKEALQKGIQIPKGSIIDIQAGDGQGRTYMEVPDVRGQPFDRARTILIGMGLSDGAVEYVKAEEELGIVVEQNPNPGARLKIGSLVKLSVAGYFPEDEIKKDSLKTQNQDSLNVEN